MYLLFLKLFALITMIIDHVGYIFNVETMRIIGRVSFPIYAYLIGQGCELTKNPKKRILKLLFTALISLPIYCTLFNYQSYNVLNIIFVYAFFSLVIYIVRMYKLETTYEIILFSLSIITLLFVYSLISMYTNFNIQIEYGLYGFLTVYLFYKIKDPVLLSISFITLNIFYYFNIDTYSSLQLYSVFSLIFIIPAKFIKEKEYKYLRNFFIKNFFYIIYPLHLLILLLLKITFKW